jgi:hypothetical protein
VPETILEALDDEASEAAEGGAASVAAALPAVATVVEAATGGAAAEAAPPVMGAAVPVPFWAMANCSNIAWVLLAVGLMENVIPFPQCPFCLQ